MSAALPEEIAVYISRLLRPSDPTPLLHRLRYKGLKVLLGKLVLLLLLLFRCCYCVVVVTASLLLRRCCACTCFSLVTHGRR